MSTRSSIAIVEANGEVKSVYCHHDGYPECNGRILLEHYNTEEKVRDLIALGSLSSLGARVAPERDEAHSFDNPVMDVTVAYHRDRDEPLEMSNHKSLKDFGENLIMLGAEYAYVWKNGTWRYSKVRISTRALGEVKSAISLKPLTARVFKRSKNY